MLPVLLRADLMIAVVTAVLAGAAVFLLIPGSRLGDGKDPGVGRGTLGSPRQGYRGPDRPGAGRHGFGGRSPDTHGPETHGRSRHGPEPGFPIFLHEMSALLRAGRSHAGLWQDLLLVYRACDGSFAAMAVTVCAAAHAACLGGHSAGGAVKACVLRPAVRAGPRPRRRGTARNDAARDDTAQWLELARCLEISERSGAPLAGLLSRLARQGEARLDLEQARQSALAGPKATLRLLGWLPASGLLLGWAMGVDPLGALTGSAVGRGFLGLGVLLMILSRWWSGRLVRAAGRAT